jgi:hypothetical protein
MQIVSLKQLYTTLIKESSETLRSEDDLLLWMLLLLTHEIHLKEAVIEEFPDRLVMPPITQRYATEVLSACWPEQEGGSSARSLYRRFQLDIGNPAKAAVLRRAQLDKLVSKLQQNPYVDRVTSA